MTDAAFRAVPAVGANRIRPVLYSPCTVPRRRPGLPSLRSVLPSRQRECWVIARLKPESCVSTLKLTPPQVYTDAPWHIRNLLR
jgi:hypothetical protein